MGTSNVTVDGVVVHASNYQPGQRVRGDDGYEYIAKPDPYWDGHQIWVSSEIPEERQCLRCDKRSQWHWVYDPGYTSTGLPAADPFVVKLCADHMPKSRNDCVFGDLMNGLDCAGCGPDRCDYPACRGEGMRPESEPMGSPFFAADPGSLADIGRRRLFEVSDVETQPDDTIVVHLESVNLDRGDPV